MSEKPPGLPPGQSNCDDANLQIIRNAHAQMQKFVATIGNTVMACESGPLTLRAESAMMMNATLIKPVGLTVASPVLGQPDLAVHSKEAQAPNRPAFPYRLLTLFAKSKRDVARVGCINEQFERDFKLGPAWAHLWYWAETVQFLWPLFVRAIGRATKLAVVIDVLKRIFFG